MDNIEFLQMIHNSQGLTDDIVELLDTALDEAHDKEHLEKVLDITKRHLKSQATMIRGFAEEHVDTKSVVDEMLEERENMSADNGYILRKNPEGKYVLIEYSASEEYYPPLSDPKAQVFDTLEEAILAFETQDQDYPSEYGLTIRIKKRLFVYNGRDCREASTELIPDERELWAQYAARDNPTHIYFFA